MTKVLKSMANGKSPGLDSLVVEFYKVFWNQLKQLYYEAIMFAKRGKILYVSARRGVTCFVPKRNKDALELKNWRPLTMLNIDHKIIAKAIASRMKTVLHYLIGPQQTGYMQGRFIGTDIRKLIYIIQYVENEQIDAILIAIDFQKCFDTIEVTAIEGALRYFNFGEN